jgi:hypothetical protein
MAAVALSARESRRAQVDRQLAESAESRAIEVDGKSLAVMNAPMLQLQQRGSARRSPQAGTAIQMESEATPPAERPQFGSANGSARQRNRNEALMLDLTEQAGERLAGEGHGYGYGEYGGFENGDSGQRGYPGTGGSAMGAPDAAGMGMEADYGSGYGGGMGAGGMGGMGGQPAIPSPATEPAPSGGLDEDLATAQTATDRRGSGRDPAIGKYWALQGLRGLAIRIDHRSSDELTFRSLGTEPLLDIVVFQKSRMNWLALSVAILIIAAGLVLAKSRVGTRIRFVVLIAILACGLPSMGGLATEFTPVFQQALLAALILIPIWVAVALVTRSWQWIRRRVSPATAAATVLAIVVFGLGDRGSIARAQDISEILKPLLEPSKPIQIPDDAVVIPYDPDVIDWRAKATQVLVPYSRYVELWNQAYPDRKIGAESPQPFALAGARYEATLAGDEQILLSGTVDIEIFADGPVDVPLALGDGIITSAMVDGKPARLKTIAASPAVGNPQPQAAQQRAEPAPRSIAALLLEGKGRHQLELTVRVAIRRQGGWRSAQATIPHAVATSIRLTVPEAGTTVRRPLGGVVLTETTDGADQTLDTTLQPGGIFDVTWRPRISPGSIDQALTADSSALVDVREDGLRVIWHIALKFGQDERGTFVLQVPSEYLVERIDGSNVRGWDTTEQGDQTTVSVELLKAVRQQEELVIHLSRRATMTVARGNTFAVPSVAIPDAALHRGVLQIRRSPILELQTGSTSGVSRTDGAAMTKKLEPLLGDQKSPFGVRDYQAYRFNATPFAVEISATEVQSRVTTQLRTILGIGESELTLESEIRFVPQRRSLYEVSIAMPADLQVQKVVAAGLADWSLNRDGDRPVLRAFFSAGQQAPFTLTFEGELSDHTATDAVPIPQLQVLDVDQQSGGIVVKVDPSLEARAIELDGCESVLLERVLGWLNDQQRPLARLGLEYRGDSYAGKIQLSRRAPRVSCDSITNVRITYRTIQETILLDFSIEEAGVRQIRFQLPNGLRDARILAPRTRQQTITPVEGTSYVQVRLELQDAITGQYRVVVENDRAIEPGRQTAPLPLFDPGVVRNRYVVLQNAGRDEIVMAGTPGMEQVDRQSQRWGQLTERLRGGNFTTAYVATGATAQSEFGYQTKQRARIITAGATIGLAQTVVVVDASGAYRASMLLKMDNRTEPHLEIRLPADARLWTAHVAGRPVKPAHSLDSADESLMRIPLIKTVEGDLDYDVVLKYAGKLDGLGFFQPVQFPVIRTQNINIERSQVKLHLPVEYRWFQFDGTATRVGSQSDFDADFVSYETQKLEKLTQILRSANQFSQSRAMFNIKKQSEEFRQWKVQNVPRSSSDQLRKNLESNARASEAATQAIAEQAEGEEMSADNRAILNSFYQLQRNDLSRNSATRVGGNFDMPAPAPAAQPPSSSTFNNAWFLGGKGKGLSANKPDDAKTDSRPQKGRVARLIDEQSYRVQQQMQEQEQSEAAGKVFQLEGQALQQQTGQMPSQPATAGGRFAVRGRGQEQGSKSELKRAYQDKIQRDGQQSLSTLADDFEQQVQLGDMGDATPPTGGPAIDLSGRTGLASLDFELPTRGQVFFFKTPRGEVEITARPVKREFSNRLLNLGLLLGMLVALGIATAVFRRVSQSRVGRIVSVLVLCGAGLVMMLFMVFPIFGLAMFFGSILLALDLRRPGEDGNRNDGPASFEASAQ